MARIFAFIFFVLGALLLLAGTIIANISHESYLFAWGIGSIIAGVIFIVGGATIVMLLDDSGVK